MVFWEKMGKNSSSHEILYYLFLFVLTLMFFYNLILHPGQILNSSDAIASDMFRENTLLSSLRNSQQFPLWSNYHFSGIPLIGNPVNQFFYPLNILFLVFPQNLFISYSFLIHVFLTGLFTYLFARKIGLGKFPGLVSAISFMFSAVVVGKIYPGHLGSVIVISLMPLMFYLMENLITEPSLKNSIIFGVFWCIQLVGGMLQLFYYSSLALAVYLLLRLVSLSSVSSSGQSFRRALKILSYVFLGLVVCILISSAYLLPTYQLSQSSGRTGGLDFVAATHMSFDPKQLITVIIPNFFGSVVDSTYWGSWENPWVSYIYLGILPLLLALFGIIFKRDKYTKILLTIGALALLFAFGRYTPLYKLAYYLIPGISMFRVPAEAVFIFCFSLSVIAGYGASFLISPAGNPRFQKTLLKLLGIGAVLAILLTLLLILGKTQITDYGTNLARQRYYTLHPGGTDFEERYLPKLEAVYGHIAYGTLWFTLLYSASVILLWLRISRKLNRTAFAALLILIILIDLWAFSLPLISLKKLDEIYPKTELFELLASDSSRFRVLDLSGYIQQQVLPKYGIESITGYDPMLLNEYQQFTSLAGDISDDQVPRGYLLTNIPLQYVSINNLTNPKILDLLNVKYLISREKTNKTGFRLVLEKQGYMLERELDPFKYYSNKTLPLYVYQNENLLPRAFLVGNVKTVRDRRQILQELKSDSFDPTEYVILEDEFDKPLSEKNSFEEANLTYYSPNKIIIETSQEKPGILFISEIWQPGWNARDNLELTEIYRANYIFRAIYLPPGVHKIEMYYDPLPFKLGMVISGLALVLIISLLIYLHLKK